MTPGISVIMPVYNTAAYLGEAVDSVLSQSMQDWELLLVDDGSTDGSGALCDRYAAGDGRIKAFHAGKAGCGHARNLGLARAKGGHILFLDSDDRLSPHALQCLLEGGEGADLVMALQETFPVPGRREKPPIGGRFETVGEMREVLTEVYEPYFLLSVCAKMYRRERLGGGFAEEKGPLCDWLFNFSVLPACRGIRLVPETVYYYRWGDHVSTTCRFHGDWLYISRTAYLSALALFPEDPGIRAYLAGRYADRVAQHLRAIASLKSADGLRKRMLIEAEREDPFYQRTEILRAACGEKNREIWRAFLARDAQGALFAAEAGRQAEE